ncbi:MAG TPA: hypothetical protein VH500_04145 [Nitrososphaeraceae archaeon]|jgi:hypothetical protein
MLLSYLTSVSGAFSLQNVVVQLLPVVLHDRTQQTQQYLSQYLRDTYKLKVYWADISEFSAELKQRLEKFER